MRDVVADTKLIAACGLYCGACKAYLKGRCPGCRDNEKASWCKIRACCLADDLASCADCEAHPDPTDCSKFDSLLGRVIGFVLNSNRAACVARIREVGPEAFAAEMAEQKKVTLPRRGR